MVRVILSTATIFGCLLATCAEAQFEEPETGAGVRYGETGPARLYKVGVRVRAVGGPCRGLFATLPVPFDWPEQEVRVDAEDFSPEVQKVDYRMLEGTVRQMLVSIPRLEGGQEAHAIVTFEVRKRAILPPEDTAQFEVPKKLNRQLKKYLAKSPFIEVRHRTITSLAREISESHPAAWEKVDAIYEEVQRRVEYKTSPLKGAVAALRDGNGDCEDLTSLFIALCRANKIPARTVWVPGHCYPEFYLTDAENNGYWFPCQVAGTRSFGEMEEQRPILQKGDNFKVPEKPRDRERYVAELLKGLPVRGGGKPKVQFIREMVN